MTQRTAILQTSADSSTAVEALDLALALASMDQPVQLILSGAAAAVLQHSPSKRYAMLELLDADPILIVSDQDPVDAGELDVEQIPADTLRTVLDTFDEVLHFS